MEIYLLTLSHKHSHAETRTLKILIRRKNGYRPDYKPTVVGRTSALLYTLGERIFSFWENASTVHMKTIYLKHNNICKKKNITCKTQITEKTLTTPRYETYTKRTYNISQQIHPIKSKLKLIELFCSKFRYL